MQSEKKPGIIIKRTTCARWPIHKQTEVDLMCKDLDWVHVWVDGGGNSGPVSLGVVVVIDGMVTMTYGQFLGDNMTNNIAELTAILKGLQIVRHLKKGVRIYGDSAYAINSICEVYAGKENRELIDKIINYVAKYPYAVEFVKVKGHSGLVFNEYADSIASWFLSEEKENGKRKRKKSKSS